MKLKNIRSDFTMVPNQWFKSKLSLRAIGLISLLQSLPDNWDFTVAGIQKLTKDGKGSIQSALNELIDAGFVMRKQVKGESGRFSHNVIELKVRKTVGGETVDRKTVDGETATINIINNKEKIINKNKDILSKDSIGETPKTVYGNSEINGLFDEWEDAFEYRPKNSQANRRAAYNLLRNKNIGKERLVGIIRALPKLQMQTYCVGSVKKVSDFASLQREWDSVWNMAYREWKKQKENEELTDWRI